MAKKIKRDSRLNNKSSNNLVMGCFNKAIKYLKEIKFFIFLAIILFFLSSFFGYVDLVGKLSPELGEKLQENLLKSVAEIMEQTKDLGPVELTVFIMNNNIKTSFFSVVFGIYLGILPLFVIIFNGYILGFVAERAVNSPINEIGPLILWRLFPHGIFEIPAILIAVALGIKLGSYPLYIKEKIKGFFSLLISFGILLFSLSIISFIITLIINPDILINKNINQETINNLIYSNPYLMILFFLLIALIFVISIIIGIRILNRNDRNIVIETIKNTARTFILIVVPLLVIAGIIEGILIALS